MAAVLFAATAAHGWLIVSSVPARATDDGMFGQQLAAIATCLWPPPQRLSAGFLPPNHQRRMFVAYYKFESHEKHQFELARSS